MMENTPDSNEKCYTLLEAFLLFCENMVKNTEGFICARKQNFEKPTNALLLALCYIS